VVSARARYEIFEPPLSPGERRWFTGREQENRVPYGREPVKSFKEILEASTLTCPREISTLSAVST